MQVQRSRVVQAKPKINPADHPMLKLNTEIEGNGQFRGKACLMLNRTATSVTLHAVLGTP
jgi:hypothetical protein